MVKTFHKFNASHLASSLFSNERHNTSGNNESTRAPNEANGLRRNDDSSDSRSRDWNLHNADPACSRQHDLRNANAESSQRSSQTEESQRVAAQPEDVFLPERSVTARPLNSVPYPYPMESVLKELSSTEYAMDQPTSSKALTRTITVRRKEPVLKERNGKAIKTKLRSLCPCLANSEINLESSDEENQSQAESQRRLANDLESSQVANAESVEMLSCAAKNIRQQMASLALSNGERSRASSENELTVHRLVEYAYHLVPDLNKIYAAPYYHGVMDRYEAEKLLDEKPEGTFLLRDSAQTGYLFSVSFRRYQRTLHARIEQANHRFGFDILDESIFSAPTVSQLIDNYKDPQKCLFFEPCLNLPLRRTNVFSLQELSRAAIASHTTYAKVSKLRLPNKLKEYVRSYYYMTPVRSINIIN